jgi:GTP cyclohydrolase I
MKKILNGTDKDIEDLSKQEKIEYIQFYFSKIMEVLELDLTDDTFKDTPRRVAEMYINEIFRGLDPDEFPQMTAFDNGYAYDDMLIQKDITVYSCCAHHFVPIIGKAHVAYFPSDTVVGLSKLNRLVDYFARRPQVQEKLTMDIAGALKNTLGTEDIALLIEADHLCVSSRGVNDTNSTSQTSYYGGKFKQPTTRQEFLRALD